RRRTSPGSGRTRPTLSARPRASPPPRPHSAFSVPRARENARMAPPRALWSGTISFGLVNVPVRLYSAIQDHTLHFHYVHEKDDSRIGYEKICKAEGVPVPDDEIVRAFEYE